MDGKFWKGEKGYLPGLGTWLAWFCWAHSPPLPTKINIPRRSGSKINPYQMKLVFPGLWDISAKTFFPTPSSLWPYHGINSFTCHQYNCLSLPCLSLSNLRCLGPPNSLCIILSPPFPTLAPTRPSLALSPLFMVVSTSALSGYPGHFLPTRYFLP